nr:aminotransferase class IV [Sabulibacter ruber]
MPFSNRAFQYSDGFFETMIMQNGKVRFWQDHLDRVLEAAAVLKMEIPSFFNKPALSDQLEELARKNHCAELGRLKWKIWRTGAGLYTPQTDAVEWIVTAAPSQSPAQEFVHAQTCTSVQTYFSPFSGFKGVHSPIYVLASREKKEKAADDLLLLDGQGHVAELTASSIFWIKENTLFNPSLQTGCLNGIARRNLMRLALQLGYSVAEGLYKPELLQEAEVVFAANVTGIKQLSGLDQLSFPVTIHPFLIAAETLF